MSFCCLVCCFGSLLLCIKQDIGLINSGVCLLTEHGLYSATITSTFQDFMEG